MRSDTIERLVVGLDLLLEIGKAESFGVEQSAFVSDADGYAGIVVVLDLERHPDIYKMSSLFNSFLLGDFHDGNDALKIHINQVHCSILHIKKQQNISSAIFYSGLYFNSKQIYVSS